MIKQYKTHKGDIISLTDEEYNVYPKNIHLKLIEREASRTQEQTEVKLNNGKHTRKRRRTKTRVIG